MTIQWAFIMGSNISSLGERSLPHGSAQLTEDPNGTQNW